MEYDPDDLLPQPTITESYWFYMNRAAEWGMFLARLCGWKETVMRFCESRYCSKPAGMRKTVYDERIDKKVDLYFCSDKCVREEMTARHGDAKVAHLVFNIDNPAGG